MATASAGTITVNSTGENIYSDTAGCGAFYVRCSSTSATTALINIPGLHTSGEFFPLPAGCAMMFRMGINGITSVFAKGTAGNATAEFGVAAKNIAAGWTPVGG